MCAPSCSQNVTKSYMDKYVPQLDRITNQLQSDRLILMAFSKAHFRSFCQLIENIFSVSSLIFPEQYVKMKVVKNLIKPRNSRRISSPKSSC